MYRLPKDKTLLRKKGRGRLIHVSDCINELGGRLAVRDADGAITKEARKIIYPGSNGDAWWDNAQMMKQMDEAILVFEEAYPGHKALFIFDQSSNHAAMGDDSLQAFTMNLSNGGKQRRQRNTIIPDNNPHPAYRNQPQSMTTESGEAKGLKQTLEERGFDVKGMKSKCSPRCDSTQEKCCMARLLSHQDDFRLQTSQLEKFITGRDHYCIFLPKFHCELNPIEMVSYRSHFPHLDMSCLYFHFTVLGLGQVQIQGNNQKGLCCRQESCFRCPG